MGLNFPLLPEGGVKHPAQRALSKCPIFSISVIFTDSSVTFDGLKSLPLKEKDISAYFGGR